MAAGWLAGWRAGWRAGGAGGLWGRRAGRDPCRRRSRGAPGARVAGSGPGCAADARCRRKARGRPGGGNGTGAGRRERKRKRAAPDPAPLARRAAAGGHFLSNSPRPRGQRPAQPPLPRDSSPRPPPPQRPRPEGAAGACGRLQADPAPLRGSVPGISCFLFLLPQVSFVRLPFVPCGGVSPVPPALPSPHALGVRPAPPDFGSIKVDGACALRASAVLSRGLCEALS